MAISAKNNIIVTNKTKLDTNNNNKERKRTFKN